MTSPLGVGRANDGDSDSSSQNDAAAGGMPRLGGMPKGQKDASEE